MSYLDNCLLAHDLISHGVSFSRASKTNKGKSDNRGYRTEVIYSGSDQDYDLRDKKTPVFGVFWGTCSICRYKRLIQVNRVMFEVNIYK